MKKGEKEEKSKRKTSPSMTPEESEQRCINYATSMAEEQLRNGTASSQVMIHFLKLGSAKAKLETEKLKHETELVKAKTESLESQRKSEELLDKAIKAFKGYAGEYDEDEQYD